MLDPHYLFTSLHRLLKSIFVIDQECFPWGKQDLNKASSENTRLTK
jgi:hypothetical protein